jgi:hypothetical protein
MTVTLRPGQVRLYPGEPKRWVVEDPATLRELERRMARVKRGARSLVRRRTGYLYSTIRNNNGVSGLGVYVDTIAGARDTQYTMIEHDGSKPHIITPRRRKTLRFVAGGRVVFATKVHHPGTRGTEFLTRALPLAAG